jgi:hypothetical protein
LQEIDEDAVLASIFVRGRRAIALNLAAELLCGTGFSFRAFR